ncbi:hypothetical protein [uncultured Thiodictyon sp.]|uniref:DUF7227 family protein n=1 Tax=uncultured Thiodictyon sp. TaxID=1846217 RepID=UPI0025F9721E|nr:hypothetical protein [uncultured Thiodictyon sp.]
MQAIAVENSNNKKLGGMSTTYASLQTCPKDCPFLKSKSCYAMMGPCAVTKDRIGAKRANSKLSIAKQEARAIDTLSGRWPLRIHTIGDCSTAAAARTVAKAAKRFMAKHNEAAYTYTHAWRTVPRSAWGKVSVLASCETVTEVRAAKAKGYAATLVLEKFASDSVHFVNGVRVMPCLKQTGRSRSCLDCGLCMKEASLKKAGLTIGFKVHGPSVKAAMMLAAKNPVPKTPKASTTL